MWVYLIYAPRFCTVCSGVSPVAVGVMHIPQSADVVAFNLVKRPARRGVGIYAVGFHQQGDALLLRIGDQGPERL